MDRFVDLKGNYLFTPELSRKGAAEVIGAMYGAQRTWLVGYHISRHTIMVPSPAAPASSP